MTGQPDEQERLSREWLHLAEEDFLLAEEIHRKASAYRRGICFHLQQAVEKYLKAVLTRRAIPFNRTHDIESLVNLLPPELAEPLRRHDVLDLTEYAVDTRYPSLPSAEIEPHDVERASDAARFVRDFLRKAITD